MFFDVGGGLALFHLAEHLLQQLGMGEQVFAQDAFDLAALIRREGLRRRRCGRRKAKRDRKQRGG